MERLRINKCVFSSEDEKYIKTKYLEGVSLEKIAEKFGCCSSTISRKLKEMQIVYKPKCPICKKIFIARMVNQKYCNNPCNHNYNEERRDIGQRYLYIRAIRRSFYELINSNPEKALQLQKEMEQEEDKEFRDMVLGKITQTDDFKNKDKIFKKYKHLWKEGETI